MTESAQKWLLRNRPPRVRITYDVETGGAIEKIELPFIVGIFSALSGDGANPVAKVKDRKMVDIDRDSFNQVLASAAPVAKYDTGDGLRGEMTFTSLDDFSPLQVVKNVPALATAYSDRRNIRSVQSKSETDDDLFAMLTKYVGNPSVVAGQDTAMTTAATTKTTADAAKSTSDKALADANAAVATAKAAQAKADADSTAAAAAAAVVPGTAAKTKVAADAVTAATTAATAVTTATTALTTATTTAQTNTTAAANAATAFATAKDAAAKAWQAAAANDFPQLGADEMYSFKTNILDNMAIGLSDAAGKSLDAIIDEQVAQIDQNLSANVSKIMHGESFQNLEATWRGMFYLVSNTETNTTLKLRVFNATYAELLDDMQKAVEFDQSTMFKMVYEAEYGTYGGEPFSLLVGAYELGPDNQDVSFLQAIAKVAASAHAPFIAAAKPEMFGLKDFDTLGKPRDLAKVFESPDKEMWNEFRQEEDARYVTLVLPRALLRLPYGQNTQPAEGFDFEEDVIAAGTTLPDNKKFLWGNASYFLASCITNAFSLYSWTAAIRGTEGGGLVEGLPIYTFSTSNDSEGILELFCPTEVSITDRREKELNDLGFIALCHQKGTGKAAFFGGQTTNLPKKYITDEANANAKLSATLPYILAASRFAHYIKVMVRDKIGSFMTRENVQVFLNTWISQYVLLDDSASQEVKSSFPLRSAQIVLVDVPGSPGSYKATVFLKPHFQLEELTTSIRLVADLPA